MRANQSMHLALFLDLKYIIGGQSCIVAEPSGEKESKFAIKASLKSEKRDDRTPPLM
jgi:hypothetical protein